MEQQPHHNFVIYLLYNNVYYYCDYVIINNYNNLFCYETQWTTQWLWTGLVLDLFLSGQNNATINFSSALSIIY